MVAGIAHPRRVVLLLALLFAAALALAPRADAYIYWAQFPPTSSNLIGRASLDGTDIDRGFIKGLGGACGVALNATHIFWGNSNPPSIGRANIDGTGVDPDFIPLSGGRPCGVAVDAAHIWWANIQEDKIGRANLNGTDVNQGMFTAPHADDPCGVAVGPGLVYWANNPTTSGSISHAGNPEPPPPPAAIVPDAGEDPCWVAVTANHVYWATFPVGILRANLAGENVAGVAGSNGRGGLGILDQRIYWASLFEGTISSANLDGSSPTFAFVQSTGGVPSGLAVDSKGPPPDLPTCGELALGELERNKKKGTGKLAVEVGCAGSVELGGKGLKPAAREAAGAGELQLPVKAKGKKKKALRRKGKAKVEAEVTFTPGDGEPETQTKNLKLKKR